jgi:large subunit ribosomal protein L4
MPKRKYRAAVQSALSAKVAGGQVVIVSNLSLQQPKTKVLAKALDQFGKEVHALLVAGEGHLGLAQAARNLSHIRLVAPERLNVYDVVRAHLIVIPERELARVKEVWA